MRFRWLRPLLVAVAIVTAAAVSARAQDTAPATAAAADSVAVHLPDPQIRRWQVGLLRPDRMQHASLSLTLGLAAGLMSGKPAFAAGGVLALGLAKEFYDMRGSGFDPVDLLADGLGAGTAAIGTHYLQH